MSDMDQQLRRALDERTEGVRIVADLADRAIARDRSNRRRELGVAALAAGLVLAVAVPVGWGALRPSTVRPLPIGPSQSTTTPTGGASVPTNTPRTTSRTTPTAIPTLTADGAPAPTTVRFASGAPTATSEIPYLLDGVIHDGTAEKEVGNQASGGYLARLAGGRWLVAQRETGEFRVLQPLGLPTVSVGSGKATVSTDGTLIVVETRGTLRAYDASGTRVRALAAATCDCAPEGASSADTPGYDAIGIVGSVVYANRGFTGEAVAWDVVTGERRSVKGSVQLVNATQGTALVALPQRRGSDQTCTELRGLASGRTLWRLCGPLVFRSFSADGDYLLATGYSDGLPDSQLNPDRTFRYGGLVVVRTKDGAIILEGGTEPGGAGSPVTYRMGRDDSITVQVGSTTGQRNLQKCTLGGACEVVAPSRGRDNQDIPEGDDPYYLSTN